MFCFFKSIYCDSDKSYVPCGLPFDIFYFDNVTVNCLKFPLYSCSYCTIMFIIYDNVLVEFSFCKANKTSLYSVVGV